MKYAVLCFITGLACAAVIANKPQSTDLAVRSLVVSDELGRPRIVLKCGVDGDPEVALLNGDASIGLRLRVLEARLDKNGLSQLELVERKSGGTIQMQVTGGVDELSSKIALGHRMAGSPSKVVNGVVIDESPTSGSMVSIADSGGSIRVATGVGLDNNKAYLELWGDDSQGKAERKREAPDFHPRIRLECDRDLGARGYWESTEADCIQIGAEAGAGLAIKIITGGAVAKSFP